MLSSNSSSGASTTISLSGSSTPQPNPQLTLSAQTLTFDGVAVGTSVVQALTLKSVGTSPVTISAATTAGSGFSVSGGSLPKTLNPTETLVLQVDFSPTSIGSTTGQLTISSDSISGSTITVSLKGAGTPASVPQLTIGATSLSFGSTPVNTAVTQALTLTSTGTLPVTVSAATISGSGFSIAGGTLPVTLAPTQAITLQIQFKPTGAGSDTGQVTITSNSATASSAVIALSGSGTVVSRVVDLSWSAPTSSSDPIVGYNVYRSSGSSGLQLLNSSPEAKTAFVDSAVVSGTTYNYIVKSVDAGSTESDASNQIAISVP